MDGQRFDEFARFLATDHSRRKILKGLAGLVFGRALAGRGHGEAAAQSACERGQIRCPDGSCADLRTDPANCGRCGTSCPGGVCHAGRCREPEGCPSGFGVCNGTCVRECSGGATFNQHCDCVCPDGSARCSGSCVDLTTDTNCGACGNRCQAPNTCGGGDVPGECGCAPESDAAACQRQGVTCGPTTNNCGHPVANCGTCQDCFSCQVGTCAPLTGTPCDDGDLCTMNDACANGVCAGSPYTCEPNECQTSSACDGLGDCIVTNEQSGTPCGVAVSCENGFLTPRGACNGDGACIPGMPESCDPYAICNDTGTGCATSCADDDDCLNVAHCDAQGQCVGDHPDGIACSSPSQCQSGHCVDGYCCDSACNGQCEACNVVGDEGACLPVTEEPVGDRLPCADDGSGCGGTCDGATRDSCAYPTTVCREASCADGVATSEASCDGQGACPDPVTTPCAPYRCGANACVETCEDETDCATDHYCEDGQCVPLLPTGTACADASQCLSGFCVDDYCCDRECAGQCEACDVQGEEGTCAPLSGAPCDDGDLCTVDTVCSNGECIGTPRECEATAPCQEAVCVPTEGCQEQPKPEGSPCDDGDICTEGSTCQSGNCHGGTPVAGCCVEDDECPAPDNPCQQAICVNNACGVEAVNNGTVCGAGNDCVVNQVCQDGACVAGEPIIICDPCERCDPDGGACVPDPAANNTSCGANRVYCAGTCCEAPSSGSAICSGGNTCDFQCTGGFFRCGSTCCASGQQCINETCCPDERICLADTMCCNSGTTCVHGSECCSPPSLCGDTCCNSITERCVRGGLCCPTHRACHNDNTCCPEGFICLGDTCCPEEQNCGHQGCCPSGQVCVNNECCPAASACGNVCCPNGLTCHNGDCCAPHLQCDDQCCPGQGDVCVRGVCCPRLNLCLNEAVCCPDGSTCLGNQECCPAPRVCGSVCCPLGQHCVNGTCCPEARACGNQCCDEGNACTGMGCCPEAQACGSVCCSSINLCRDGFCCQQSDVCGDRCCIDLNDTCVRGACCPSQRVCLDGKVCCPDGQTCVGNATCCPTPSLCEDGSCCPDGDICLRNACCPPERACGQQCCPTGEFCVNDQCAAPTCFDRVRNGDETDIDCGGPLCPACHAGSHCAGDGDCRSGRCCNGICCATNEGCYDGICQPPPPLDDTCPIGSACTLGNGPLPQCGPIHGNCSCMTSAEGTSRCGIIESCPGMQGGSSCVNSADCAAGSFCAIVDGCCGSAANACVVSCAAVFGPGSPCNVDDECVAGTCDQGQCACPERSELCGSGQCCRYADGEFCIDGVCRTLPPVDDACASGRACQDGGGEFSCGADGRCSCLTSVEGEPRCADFRTFGVINACPVDPPFIECGASTDCGPGRFCAVLDQCCGNAPVNVCLPSCEAGAGAGDPCGDNEDCASGFCDPLTNECGCGPHAEPCANGQCCDLTLGAACVNGRCQFVEPVISDTCPAGSSCLSGPGNVTPCGAGPDCSCFTSAEGAARCGTDQTCPGGPSGPPASDCATSADCGPNRFCALLDECCGHQPINGCVQSCATDGG